MKRALLRDCDGTFQCKSSSEVEGAADSEQPKDSFIFALMALAKTFSGAACGDDDDAFVEELVGKEAAGPGLEGMTILRNPPMRTTATASKPPLLVADAEPGFSSKADIAVWVG